MFSTSVHYSGAWCSAVHSAVVHSAVRCSEDKISVKLQWKVEWVIPSAPPRPWNPPLILLDRGDYSIRVWRQALPLTPGVHWDWIGFRDGVGPIKYRYNFKKKLLWFEPRCRVCAQSFSLSHGIFQILCKIMTLLTYINFQTTKKYNSS